MYIQMSGLKLKGTWHQIKFEDAFEGAIGKLFFEYTKHKEESFVFYGISSHNQKDGFAYFIGSESQHGDVLLPKGNYLQSFALELAYQTYQNLALESHQFKALFDAEVIYDDIPTKIEKYRYVNHTVELIEILIPVEV